MAYIANESKIILDIVNDKDNIKQSLKLLDRLIEVDKKNPLPIIEKGLTTLYFNIDDKTIDLINSNSINNSLNMIYQGVDLSDNKEYLLNIVQKRMLKEIGMYFYIYPTYMIEPYNLLNSKYKDILEKSTLDIKSSLEDLFKSVKKYLNTQSKFHSTTLDKIEEMQKEISKLIIIEKNKKNDLYWANNKDYKQELLEKISSIDLEIDEMKSKYYDTPQYKELISIQKNYETKFIDSRMNTTNTDIKDYLNDMYLKKENIKIKKITSKLEEENKKLYDFFENKEKELKKYNNILSNSGEYQVSLNNNILHTKRLVLRTINQGDLNDFYSYASVPGVGEMAGWPHHNTINDTKIILDMMIKNRNIFALVDIFTDKMIGTIGLEKLSIKKDNLSKLVGLEIGYVLSKDYWGQGLMAEGVGEVISFCFDTLMVDYLLCAHFENNLQSKKVIEKCGFDFLEKQYNSKYGVNVLYYIKYKNKRK